MNPSERDPTILLLHDGELADLSAALEPIVGVVDRCGDPLDSDRAVAWDVVLTSSKRMLELHAQLPQMPGVCIAIVDGDSRTLRAMLRRAGTDLLVRRPVHPTALRLLILHSLYRGPEKRGTTRVSVGASIRYRSGLYRRNAILAELSAAGCRLLAAKGFRAARKGRPLTIQLPAELVDGRTLSVSGRIVRVDPAEPGADAIAVAFGKLTGKVQRRLDAVIADHRDGPAVLDPKAARAVHSPERAALDARTANPAEESAEPSDERRGEPRHALSRRVIALSEQASRVLVGRDLSMGGMRVDPAPGLEVGDALQIALHARPGGQPLVVSARVARDDGESGIALQFVDLDEASRACLAETLAALPAIESQSGDGAPGVIVSEVLERRTG